MARKLRWLLCGLFVAITLVAVFYKKNNLSDFLWSDAEGYYMYLPAIFIYDGFEELPIKTIYQFERYPGTNKVFTKYTCGVAILELPFFLVAHGIAKVTPYEANGYSKIYEYGILMAAIFYAFWGIWLCYHTLLRNWPPWLAFLAPVILLLGSNMYYYMTREPGMSHIYSFFLFSALIYQTPHLYKSLSWSRATFIGFTIGLIVLIRPTNLVILLYPMLIGLQNWTDVQNRLQYFLKQIPKLAVVAITASLLFIPQFLYWKHVTGSAILYSYGDEGFPYWKMPRIDMVLFHIRNGWWLHSPLMAIVILGLLIGSLKKQYGFWIVSLIFVISLYTFSSWWCYWFGGAFGYRSFVEFNALFIFPCAYVLQFIYQNRYTWIKITGSFILFILVYYSMGLTYLYRGPHFDWNTLTQSIHTLFPLLN